MTRIRHLKNAPIVEALIDLRATLAKGFHAEEFRGLQSTLQETYPIMEEQFKFEAALTMELSQRQTSSTASTSLGGFLFKSADGKNIAQFRLDGFTYSRLRPYTSWSKIFPEALRLWAIYCHTAKPETCTRIAVRYINRIEIPIPSRRLSEYLNAPPPPPPGVSGSLAAFLTRVVVHDSKKGIWATLTQGSQPGLDPRQAGIILDIEAYKETPVGTPEDQVKTTLGSLRTLKNRIFFGSLTSAVVKRYA